MMEHKQKYVMAWSARQNHMKMILHYSHPGEVENYDKESQRS